MIRKRSDYKLDFREKMRGGDGTVKIEHIWLPETELKAKNRLFSILNLEPGSSIGYHIHENEEEVFVILKGTAEVDDDGSKKTLNQGDSILTGNGAGHSIKNIGQENLEVLAVISSYHQQSS